LRAVNFNRRGCCVAGAGDSIVAELRRFFEPLILALASPHEFAAFMRRFGFNLGGGDLTGAVAQLTQSRTAMIDFAALARAAVANGLNASDVVTLANSARPLLEGLRTISQAFSGVVPAGMSAQAFTQHLTSFPEELFNTLVTDYLTDNTPAVLHILAFLDVTRVDQIPATGDPKSRGIAYSLPAYDWDRISLLFDDPQEWAAQAYDWGVDFDSDKFIYRLTRIIEYLGATADIDDMTNGQVAAFMPHVAAAPVRPIIAYAPIMRVNTYSDAGDLDLDASGEFGVALFPVAGEMDATRRSDGGIAVAPYTRGMASQSLALNEFATMTLTGSIGAVGGVIFAFRPSGAALAVGVEETAYSGSFSVELAVAPPPGQQTIIFLGRENETRIEANAVVASLGGEASNAGSDFYVAGGVRNLKAVIDPGDDGLLSALISDPIEITAGDILVGWRYGRGVYFEGGSNLTVSVPLNLDLGPISIEALSLTLSLSRPPSITAAVTGALAIGPFYAYAEGIGVTAVIVEDPDGILGNHDLRFGFKAPTGYALSLDAAPISGGGMIAVYEHEYRGALALKFERFGFSAFALLSTRLPNGADGFSLAASIFGEFNLPLGYGFFLTGVGGVIGVNRTVDTNAMREVLFEGRFTNLLFPADPIANAAKILEDMAAILPPREGQHLIGPVARIGWGTPILIEVTLGVVIEFGSHTRVLVVGSIASNLPTKDAALVSLNLAFFGEIDFAAGTISFDATLENSRILTWTISGDGAFRTGWAPRLDHVASIGGLHPSYPRPANLPDLRRLSINFGTNNPKITLSAYAAMTLNTVQFGARADLYAKGPKIWLVGRLAAEGNVYFDALIYFNPFSFDTKLGGSLSLLVDGDVVAGLGFDLRLRGPNTYKINGKVWVTVFGIDVDFHIEHEWGDEQSLPPATIDAVAVLRGAIERSAVLEPVVSAGRVSGVALASGVAAAGAIDPGGGARFVQRAVPLGVALSKIGEAQIAGASTLDLKAFGGSTALSLAPTKEEFVRGHFFALSEAERLRSPEFERFKAGFELSPDALVVDPAKAIVETYGYEVILLGVEDDRTAPADIRTHAGLGQAFTDRWVAVNHSRVARPAEGFHGTSAADTIVVRNPAFVPDAVAADVIANAARPRADAIAILETEGTTFTETAFRTVGPIGVRAVRAPAEANRVVADYIAAAQL
jgi:hypothetical protein